MRALAERVSTNRSLMLCTFEDRNTVQDQVATTSAKLQIAEGALSAAVDQVKKYSSSVLMAEVTEHTLMNSNFQKYI